MLTKLQLLLIIIIIHYLLTNNSIIIINGYVLDALVPYYKSILNVLFSLPGFKLNNHNFTIKVKKNYKGVHNLDYPKELQLDESLFICYIAKKLKIKVSDTNNYDLQNLQFYFFFFSHDPYY